MQSDRLTLNKLLCSSARARDVPVDRREEHLPSAERAAVPRRWGGVADAAREPAQHLLEPQRPQQSKLQPRLRAGTRGQARRELADRPERQREWHPPRYTFYTHIYILIRTSSRWYYIYKILRTPLICHFYIDIYIWYMYIYQHFSLKYRII